LPPEYEALLRRRSRMVDRSHDEVPSIASGEVGLERLHLVRVLGVSYVWANV
jgi:hypothetical protein